MNTHLIKTFNYIIGLILLSTVPVPGSDLEGKSDWVMYHYNAQHTGYNDKDRITVPLQLMWQKQFTDVPVPLEPVTAIGDRIIVTNESIQNERINARSTAGIRCVNSNSGATIWAKEFGLFEVFTLDQASYFDGMIYVAENNSSDSRIAVYGLANGSLEYWIAYSAQFDDPIGSVMYEGNLYFLAGLHNGLGSFDVLLEEYNWWISLFQFDRWTPSFHNNVSYCWIAGTLFAHELHNGAREWHIQPEWDLYHDTSSSSLGKTSIINFYDGSFAPSIDTTIGMMYLIHGLHYWGTGFYGINYETQEIVWNYDHGYEDSLRSVVPTLCDGKVYACFGPDLVEFDGLTGVELQRFPLDTVTSYPFVISNGLIFASTVNETVALDLSSFEKVWEYPVGGYLTVANNRLFIATYTGEVLAFGSLKTSVESEYNVTLPETFELEQNYPNPFNPTTTIAFSLPTKSLVNLSIVNVMGQRVRSLVNRQMSAGYHTIVWDGRDNQGNRVSSGIYIYELTSENYTNSKTMLLVK